MGYIDNLKNIIIPHIYVGAWPFVGNYAKVSLGKHKHGLINNNGNVIIPTDFIDISDVEYDSAIVSHGAFQTGVIDIKNGSQLPCEFYKIRINGRDKSNNLLCDISDG